MTDALKFVAGMGTLILVMLLIYLFDRGVSKHMKVDRWKAELQCECGCQQHRHDRMHGRCSNCGDACTIFRLRKVVSSVTRA